MLRRMLWGGLAATLVAWAAGAFVLRVAVIPPERCPDVDAGTAVESALAAGAWIERVQRDDGSYLYEYDIDDDGHCVLRVRWCPVVYPSVSIAARLYLQQPARGPAGTRMSISCWLRFWVG